MGLFKRGAVDFFLLLEEDAGRGVLEDDGGEGVAFVDFLLDFVVEGVFGGFGFPVAAGGLDVVGDGDVGAEGVGVGAGAVGRDRSGCVPCRAGSVAWAGRLRSADRGGGSSRDVFPP